MRRRDLITLLGGAAVLRPLTGAAQQAERMRRLAVLSPQPNAEVAAKLGLLPAFLDELRRLGWTEGHNLAIDSRFAGGKQDLFRSQAIELVAGKPDVILGNTAPAVAALLAATRTIPIVFTSLADPVANGFVASFAHPGGNVTGFSPLEPEIAGKLVEILKEISPEITRAMIVIDAGSAGMRDAAAAAAQSLGIALTAATVSNFSDIEREIGAFAREPGGGLILVASTVAYPQRDRLIASLLQHRMPAVYSFPAFVTSGGLASYSTDRIAQFRQAAGYVDRILRGEKPGDLPVQLPTKFKLVINMKTANALGLTVSQSLLARADEVIE